MLIKETQSVDSIVKEVERQNDSMMKQLCTMNPGTGAVS